MGNISFVILNYKAYQESITCAESVLETQDYAHIRIVIVDNGSDNGSAEKLTEHFYAEKRVCVISSEKNLGFARGNNLGIQYAREHFSPDFIVAANSDIIFEQPDYCSQLVKIYERSRYDILGGDIVDVSRMQHFNPVARERNYTQNYLRKQILVSWGKAVMFRLIKWLHLKRVVAARYGITVNEHGEEERDRSRHATTREVEGKAVSAETRIDEELKGVLLHGCCMVFSKDFFRIMDGFYGETFLYAEEEILYYLAMKKGMITLYTPEITCIHKEAVSTSHILKDFCDAKIFYFSHLTNSYRLFLGLMRKDEKRHI